MRNIWIHAVCGNDLLASCFKLEVLFSSAQIQKPNFSKAAIIFPPWSVSIYFCAHVYFRVQFDSAKPPVLTPCMCVCVCQTVCKAFQTTGRAPPAVHLHSPVSSRTRWISSSVQVRLVDSLCNQSAQPLQWVSCIRKLITSRCLLQMISVTFDYYSCFPVLRCSQQCLLPSNHVLHWLL